MKLQNQAETCNFSAICFLKSPSCVIIIIYFLGNRWLTGLILSFALLNIHDVTDMGIPKIKF